MGYAIETVIGYGLNAAAATTQPLTAGLTQSFSVRATGGSTPISLETMWASFQDPGYFRVKSPRLHDDVTGIELQALGTNVSPLANEYFSQPLYSQDLLAVSAFFTAAPTATHHSFGAMNIYYDTLPGVNANFKTWAEVSAMIQSYYGVYVVPKSSATVGNWGAGVAMNQKQDQYKANSWYALLGYLTPTAIDAISIQGTDLGNLQVGGPGSIDPLITRRWFAEQEVVTGKPSIPIINSQNKGSTLVKVASATATTTYPISLLFAYLGPTAG